MEDRPLCRALLSFIYERKAIQSINTNRIFQSFLECHKYRHLARDRNNVELMMLFHDEVLPNLCQFEYENLDELSYYEEYNYEHGLAPILRHAMSDSQRFPLATDLSQDTNVSEPMVRAITANNFRDSLLKQQSTKIHQAHICASFFVATTEERHNGELLSKPEVRKRLQELRAGVREPTNDHHIRTIDYALLVHNKKRQEEGLPPTVLHESSIETDKSVSSQSIITPNQSPARTGQVASPDRVMTFLYADDFENGDAMYRHINTLANTSTPIRPPMQQRRWSASPTRLRKRKSSLFFPKLGQKFVKNKAGSFLSASLQTIPEHLVIKVREKEQRRHAAKLHANEASASQSDQSPIAVSQSDASISEQE